MSSNNDSLAMQRILKLVDENSFMEIGSLVTARNTDFNLAGTSTPSDGVITGHGLINGCLAFVYSQDASVLNGTIGESALMSVPTLFSLKMSNPIFSPEIKKIAEKIRLVITVIFKIFSHADFKTYF